MAALNGFSYMGSDGGAIVVLFQDHLTLSMNTRLMVASDESFRYNPLRYDIFFTYSCC